MMNTDGEGAWPTDLRTHMHTVCRAQEGQMASPPLVDANVSSGACGLVNQGLVEPREMMTRKQRWDCLSVCVMQVCKIILEVGLF